MSARFILSLDCEGKWGVADILTSRHARELTDEKLHDAYQAIIRLLDEFDIDATFAFVGAFAQSPEGFARARVAVEEASWRYPDYLGPALSAIDDGAQGWHGATLVDLVGNARRLHEIALHGVTHVPWTSMDRQGAEAELALLDTLDGPIRDARTFVYPRNLVAHEDVLADRGFAGFRTARSERSRASSLVSEFNLFEAPEAPIDGDAIVHIPAGFFLNWRHGLRALVPAAVTRIRARRLLASAANSDAIVHYWLHPENIVSAPSTVELLRMLLREVAEARDAGRCEVLTQLAYCRSRQSLP